MKKKSSLKANKTKPKLNKSSLTVNQSSLTVDESNPQKTGTKYDSGKLRWDLVPFAELEEVVKVFTKGAEKYGEGNWKKVKQHKKRYISAMLRHLSAYKQGEKYNVADFGIHHLAHVAWSCLTLMWFDRKKGRKK
jgi:hypothetical protein